MQALMGGLMLAGLVAGAPVRAEDWHGGMTIYGWVPAIQGSQDGPDGEPSIEITGPDVLEALQLAVMVAGEVQRDRLGFMFDLVYCDLEFDGDARRLDVSGELDTELYFASGALSWQLYDEAGARVDAYGGVRAYGVDLNFGAAIGSLSTQARTSTNWVDPIVGFRGVYPLGDHVSISGRADVGGFGVGSELSWQAYGGINYRFAERWAGTVGYRYLSIDYESDELTLDIALQGPLIGISYRF